MTSRQAIFPGKAFAIAGTFDRYSWSQLAEMITNLGGTVSEIVDKNTDYIVAGENPGSRLAKALALGVPVINETGFEALAESDGPERG